MGMMVCTESFGYSDGRVERVISAGQLVEDSDPAVKSRPQHFVRVVSDAAAPAVDRGVEQATRAPGEKSTVRKAASKKA